MEDVKMVDFVDCKQCREFLGFSRAGKNRAEFIEERYNLMRCRDCLILREAVLGENNERR